MIFTRIILSATAALLLSEFTKSATALPMRMFAFIFLGVFFFAMAWMSYLRMDGVRMPTLDRRLFEWKRAPKRTYGDIIDHVDEDVISFDDLEENEKDLCRLIADLICGTVFAALSFL
jgi:hypothetical protein